MHANLNDPAIHRGVRDTGGRVSLAIYECLKPVIGAINGVAVGVGSTMLLPMDFRLASTEARFGFVFGRLGITPEACSTWFLPRLVGHEQALEWFYSAEDIYSCDCLGQGAAVRSLHAPDELVPAAKQLALLVCR
jgi:enoyl-CoA hydratase/carnithine racemase